LRGQFCATAAKRAKNLLPNGLQKILLVFFWGLLESAASANVNFAHQSNGEKSNRNFFARASREGSVMQVPAQPFERRLALGDLVSLRGFSTDSAPNPSSAELTVAVLHRVHGSSLWEPIETGQRIRVAPKIGKNLKVVVQADQPVFDSPEASATRSERCQVVLLQSSKFDPNETSQNKDAYRVGATSPAFDPAVKMVEITSPSAPLQPPSPYRIEFDAKLLSLHKGFRFFVRVESETTHQRVFCGVSPEFVAHNSGSSRESTEPKKKVAKAKVNKKKPVKSSMPITPPDDDEVKKEVGPPMSDSGSDTPGTPKYSHIVEMDPIYPVVKEEYPQDEPWIVVGSNLFVDGRVNAFSCMFFKRTVLNAFSH
jgi:hypothetical protein